MNEICREQSQSAVTKINNLFVLFHVVPPEEPRIFDAQGKEISHIAGPFREGHELFLSCQVTGGKCVIIRVFKLLFMYIHFLPLSQPLIPSYFR